MLKTEPFEEGECVPVSEDHLARKLAKEVSDEGIKVDLKDVNRPSN